MITRGIMTRIMITTINNKRKNNGNNTMTYDKEFHHK